MGHWLKAPDRVKPKYAEKNPGLLGDKPVTNRSSHIMAYFKFTW
jgi:hypothetical protein